MVPASWPNFTASDPGWIKICGVRDIASAIEAAKQGASAIGLNFFGPSPRSVSIETAKSIADAVALVSASPRRQVQPVGVFVNHTLDEIEAIACPIGLRVMQLHGDEPPEFLQSLAERHSDWKLIKAFRIRESLRPVAEFVGSCARLNVRMAACLLDARIEGLFGGTGHVAPWDLIARDYDHAHWPRLILSGGLTPNNVATAIETVRSWGVDTASGVESSPGVKDTTLLARFVAEAQRAFAPSCA